MEQQPLFDRINEVYKIASFLENFEKDICPIYKKHQETFDGDCVHGILHISRSIILGMVFIRYFKSKHPDIQSILYAIAFHDSARRSSAEDLWEKESAENCRQYMNSKNLDYADMAASFISKQVNENNFDHKIVYDVDVLEVIRCRTMLYFDANYLKLHFQDYPTLIAEWNEFIKETQFLKHLYKDVSTLNLLAELLMSQKDKYKFITNTILA